jgi:TonB family protein
MALALRDLVAGTLLCVVVAGCTSPQATRPPAPAATGAKAGIDGVEAALGRNDPAAAVILARPLAEAGDSEAQFVVGLLTDIGAGVRLDHAAAEAWIAKAAGQGDLMAQRYLAWRGTAGFGAKADPAAAARWLAARPGTLELPAGLDVWLVVKEGPCQPKFERAYFWMLERGGEDDPIAQANLALVYLEDWWTPHDLGQHLFWLRRAADRGDAPSLERLATYYKSGILVAEDPAQALACERKAAEAGSASAQNWMGHHCEDASDFAAAVDWYRRAADQNHLPSIHSLIDRYREGGPGQPADFAAALRLCQRGAALGDAESIMNLADLYNRGDGVARDVAKSAELYRQAANKGQTRAMSMLGWIDLEGDLGKRDCEDARRWFEKAAAQGDSFSKRELGSLYENGWGVEKDLPKAFSWQEQAARDGDGWAQNHLGWMLREGLGINPDDDEAVEWFRLAVENGEPMGDANLGFHYLHGRGVPRDRKEAFNHLVAALRQTDDGWVISLLMSVFNPCPADELPPLRQALHDVVAAPDLLDAPGALPECCLSLLEAPASVAGDPSAARDLLQRLRSRHRPQSLSILARHAFLGLDMPCDIEQARAWAHEVPEGNRWTLAQIDSAAGATAEVRAAALAELRGFADKGNKSAAWIFASRTVAGLGCPQDLALAATYFAKAGVDAKQVEAQVQWYRARLSPSPALEKTPALEADTSDKGDVPPRVRFRNPPVYPFELRAANITGDATVQFVIGTDGLPHDIRVIKATQPLFGLSAEAAVSRWRFIPARKEGKPVNRAVVQSLTFNLNEETPPAQPSP